ncbi:MAG: 3'-5' exonuclease [Chitinophagaceae bacterium]|nr:3'-5' exonuclease [Chitinophagaceae bacterium]
MKLNLKRPICFIDLETTGLNTQDDRIIEIAIAKLHPNGDMEVKDSYVNPMIPISPEAQEVHGISDEQVKDCKKFHEIAGNILEFIKGCDLAGYNAIYFDFPMLLNELYRAGYNWNYRDHELIDVNNIFKISNPRNLTAAVRHYMNEDHEGAHDARADAVATMGVFLKQLEIEDLPEDITEIAKFSNYGKEILDLSGKFTYNEEGEIIFNFGPHKGTVARNEPGFVGWMLKKDFANDTKSICMQILNEKW